MKAVNIMFVWAAAFSPKTVRHRWCSEVPCVMSRHRAVILVMGAAYNSFEMLEDKSFGPQFSDRSSAEVKNHESEC